MPCHGEIPVVMIPDHRQRSLPNNAAPGWLYSGIETRPTSGAPMYTPRYLRILALAVALSAAGCGPLQIRDETAGAYVPIRNGTFELLREIIIRPGRTRTYLQDGAIVASVNEFQPHCQFEVNSIRETPQTVRADVFTITSVSTRTDRIVQAAPVQVAALDSPTALGFLGIFNWDEPRQMHAYIFRLHSEKQPDVRALICGGAFDDPIVADLPTTGEIARSLGDYGTLEPGG